EAVDAFLAQAHETIDAGKAIARNEVLDLALRAELQLLLDLDLDPEPLAVEAVLIAELVAGHREVAVVRVLVRPAPPVMHTHRVVRGDRPVEERPARLALVLRPQLVEGPDRVPELENLAFLRGEIGLRLDLLERHEQPRAGVGELLL